MHTYLYRLNTLFTIASTTLAVICVATSLTDWTIRPDPKVKLAVQSYDGLQVSTAYIHHNSLVCSIYENINVVLNSLQASNLACRKSTGMIEHG